MTTPRRPPPRTFTNDRSTPALRALSDANLTIEAAARIVFMSPKALARQLRANHLKSAYVAEVLSSVCECGVWVFHPISLEREETKP